MQLEETTQRNHTLGGEAGWLELEAIYPVSAMQQGLLFHSLYAPGSGVYFEQLACRIEGDLEVEAFRRAWQRVIDRHAILRTAFLVEGFEQALQVAHKRVEAPWREEDWPEFPPGEEADRLERWLRRDREEGFDFTKAPLMRLALLRVGER